MSQDEPQDDLGNPQLIGKAAMANSGLGKKLLVGLNVLVGTCFLFRGIAKLRSGVSLIALAITIPTLTGCGAKYDQKALEKKVAEDWRHCERVRPGRVTIEESDKKTMRYSYVLTVVVDGGVTGYTCYERDAKLLEALANKNLHQMKAGEEIPVTKEISLR